MIYLLSSAALFFSSSLPAASGRLSAMTGPCDDLVRLWSTNILLDKTYWCGIVVLSSSLGAAAAGHIVGLLVQGVRGCSRVAGLLGDLVGDA